MEALIFQGLGVGFLSVTFCTAYLRTMHSNLIYWIVSLGCAMHLPIRLTNNGSIPSTAHLTLNLISLSTTFGWNVTSNKISSWALRWPFSGVMVKYLPQNFVSHSNFEGISPKFDNWIVFVILELMTTVPNPTVSYINFISMP